MQRVVKQGLTVAGRHLYVTVKAPLAVSVAGRLLEAIQTNALAHGDVLCWSPKATRILQAIGLSRMPDLQVSDIDDVYGDQYESEDVIVVRTLQNAFYSFRHVGERFSLACMWQAVI